MNPIHAILAGGLGKGFARRNGGKRERVNAAGKFLFEQIIDEPMPFDPRFSRKRFGNDENSEMTLARARRIAMARVHLGFVDDVEARWPEPNHKLFAKSTSNGHLFLSR